MIVTKNTHKLFHKSLSKPIMKIGATNSSHSVPPILTSDTPMPNPSTSMQPILIRCHRVQLANSLLPRFLISEIPRFWICVTEFWKLTVGHQIGTTEISVSVSLRFKSCYLWSNSVPPSFTLRCHRVGHFRCNGWIFGDAYIYPFTTTHSKEKHSELFHTCPIQFFEREPPTHVLRSSHSTPTI